MVGEGTSGGENKTETNAHLGNYLSISIPRWKMRGASRVTQGPAGGT